MRTTIMITALVASTFAYPIAKRNLVTRDDLGVISDVCLDYGKKGLVHDDTGVYSTQDGLTYDDFLSFFQDCVYQGGPDQMVQGPSNSRGGQCDASSHSANAPAAASAPPPDQAADQPSSTSATPASNNAAQSDGQPQTSNDASPNTETQSSNANASDGQQPEGQAEAPAQGENGASNRHCSGSILYVDDRTVLKDDDVYSCTGVSPERIVEEDRLDIGVTDAGVEYDQAY